jgi:hypothetical protein
MEVCLVMAGGYQDVVLAQATAGAGRDATGAPGGGSMTHPTRYYWPSVFVFDQVQGPVHDISPEGEVLPPNRDVMAAIKDWDGRGCLVVHMAPQPAGRVLKASGKRVHGVRIEMKI